ncbi:hypothetical protein PHYPO_G00077250 [Pangasianodon hypophthalmus]|uniref:Uncharacterized protein n=1 Tax=Pangasianodon hypophthalmus TaxID=310915 RepID=A0A5N5LL46_PANHP|nr:hypothetical protein PHYPO_G00077250 [Pangasianodon hypophthalmus]
MEDLILKLLGENGTCGITLKPFTPVRLSTPPLSGLSDDISHAHIATHPAHIPKRHAYVFPDSSFARAFELNRTFIPPAGKTHNPSGFNVVREKRIKAAVEVS